MSRYTSILNKSKVIEISKNHNHSADKNLSRQMISNSIKRKACDDILEKPAKLINSELRSNPCNSEVFIEDINCIRENIYIARRKVWPTVPKSREEAISYLENSELKTEKEEKFVVSVTKFNEIIILSCYTNLNFLSCG
jgi:hypothetical protein